jgi:hypothetical protein
MRPTNTGKLNLRHQITLKTINSATNTTKIKIYLGIETKPHPI